MIFLWKEAHYFLSHGLSLFWISVGVPPVKICIQSIQDSYINSRTDHSHKAVSEKRNITGLRGQPKLTPSHVKSTDVPPISNSDRPNLQFDRPPQMVRCQQFRVVEGPRAAPGDTWSTNPDKIGWKHKNFLKRKVLKCRGQQAWECFLVQTKPPFSGSGLTYVPWPGVLFSTQKLGNAVWKLIFVWGNQPFACPWLYHCWQRTIHIYNPRK